MGRFLVFRAYTEQARTLGFPSPPFSKFGVSQVIRPLYVYLRIKSDRSHNNDATDKKSATWPEFRRNKVRCSQNCCATKFRRCEATGRYGSLPAIHSTPGRTAGFGQERTLATHEHGVLLTTISLKTKLGHVANPEKPRAFIAHDEID